MKKNMMEDIDLEMLLDRFCLETSLEDVINFLSTTEEYRRILKQEKTVKYLADKYKLPYPRSKIEQLLESSQEDVMKLAKQAIIRGDLRFMRELPKREWIHVVNYSKIITWCMEYDRPKIFKIYMHYTLEDDGIGERILLWIVANEYEDILNSVTPLYIENNSIVYDTSAQFRVILESIRCCSSITIMKKLFEMFEFQPENYARELIWEAIQHDNMEVVVWFIETYGVNRYGILYKCVEYDNARIFEYALKYYEDNHWLEKSMIDALNQGLLSQNIFEKLIDLGIVVKLEMINTAIEESNDSDVNVIDCYPYYLEEIIKEDKHIIFSHVVSFLCDDLSECISLVIKYNSEKILRWMLSRNVNVEVKITIIDFVISFKRKKYELVNIIISERKELRFSYDLLMNDYSRVLEAISTGHDVNLNEVKVAFKYSNTKTVELIINNITGISSGKLLRAVVKADNIFALGLLIEKGLITKYSDKLQTKSEEIQLLLVEKGII